MTVPFTPKRNVRGSKPYEYFELALALGPQAIGVTGDNRYETLYGREYLLVWDLADDYVKLYRETEAGGSWDRITDGLPADIFGSPMPATARHITFAFDQSARMIFVYEDGGTIFVTRWDSGSAQYVQNVSFAGVDPCLLMDATVADPRGYPSAEDGWSVREAYYAGIHVEFEWLAEDPPTFRDNPITDSDIVLFYLTPDRTGVRARVQRQLYATVHELHDYAQPVILDRAIALSGKYELLVSDSVGNKLASMLISDPYLGDFIINPEPINELDAVATLQAPQAVAMVFQTLPSDGLDAAGVLQVPQAVATVYPATETDEIDAAAALQTVEAYQMVAPATDENEVDATAALQDILAVQMVGPAEDTNELDATVVLQTIIAKATV